MNVCGMAVALFRLCESLAPGFVSGITRVIPPLPFDRGEVPPACRKEVDGEVK